MPDDEVNCLSVCLFEDSLKNSIKGCGMPIRQMERELILYQNDPFSRRVLSAPVFIGEEYCLGRLTVPQRLATLSNWQLSLKVLTDHSQGIRMDCHGGGP